MPKNSQPNVVILTIILSFFALAFAAAGSTAQTSKKSAKPAATPAKKSAKTAPTPGKKAQAKTTPASKNSKTIAKEKAADKKSANPKTSAKTSGKDKNSKEKTSAKTKESAAKNSASKSKTADKKSASSKSTKENSRSAAKNSKAETTKKSVAENKRASTKQPVKETAKPKSTTAKTTTKTIEKNIDSADAPRIIVTDVTARIRSQAKAGASELAQPRLGDVLVVKEKTPSWYRVQFVSGAKTASGWISANSVNDLNASPKDQLYAQIADRYYKSNGMDFSTASELYNFLNRADNLNGTNAADLELKKLLALRSALKSIPAGKSGETPYQDFIKAQDKNLVYSDPTAAWYVKSNLFWDLHNKYEKSPLADQIAWEAANNPLPGECEGYVNCYLFYGRMTSGEYLRLHPAGKKNLEALINLTNLLEPIVVGLNNKTSTYTGPTDVTDRAEFNNLLAELRTIVSRLPLTEKEKTLRQLRVIAEGFR